MRHWFRRSLTPSPLNLRRRSYRPVVEGLEDRCLLAAPVLDTIAVPLNLPVGKSLMAIRGIPLLIGRPFAVRPGTPADRVAILRDALAKTIADPELQSEATKAQIQINYISGPEVTKSFHEMMNHVFPLSILDTWIPTTSLVAGRRSTCRIQGGGGGSPEAHHGAI